MMSDAVIDACCLIDLWVTGHGESILRALGLIWHLPTAVRGEIQHVRQYDPAQTGEFLKVSVNLEPLISSGLLKVCEPVEPVEKERFIHYATQFRSDGEAMCIALAEKRGWLFATDDRKAIRVAQQAGLTVISCPLIVRRWAEASKPNQATLRQVLRDIQVLAQFKPNPSMPEYDWWIDVLDKTIP